MAYNKVVYGSNVLIDLTSDTVAAGYLLRDYTAHDASGAAIVGTCDYDADTSDANATAAQILSGYTAYVNGSKLNGDMTNRGAVTGTISTVAGTYQIQQGYHNGSGTVAISSVEQDKIIAGNIKSGVTILGVLGTYTGAGVNLQDKTVTPAISSFTVTADAGYDGLDEVTVNAIPYTETLNAAGGYTVTIAGS